MKNNGYFTKIGKEEITKALETTTRQYLVGNLQLPQLIQHIQDPDIEIGISSYLTAAAEEAPHWHPIQKEYQYVLTGRTVYTNVVTDETFEYQAGDFYAIYPEICYHQVCDKGTQILFIKFPAINDKQDWNPQP